MSKRAQVTIFIILAVLVIGAVAGFFVFKDISVQKQQYSPDILQIKNFVEDCLENQTKEALKLAELLGGVIYKQPQEIFLQEKIPYYNLQEIPINRIETEIGEYINIGLKNCTALLKKSPSKS